MSETHLLPAIRSRVGDWNYYVTTLSFEEVAALVRGPDEVHERKKLADWIQREAIDTHSEAISKYIRENEQRFLGALIVGVYDGSPDWAPLNVKFKVDILDVTDEQEERVEGKLGLLRLSGDEKLFAIDGQHRVAGIKMALNDSANVEDIESEEVSAIFVAHDASSEEGKRRTRRLFTTVNKKAKRISKAATIALDEDNGFAVLTRQLIDEHWLFEDKRKHILFSSTGSIPPKDVNSITSVVGLYEILKDLHSSRGRKKFESERPSDNELEEFLGLSIRYVDLLLENVSQYDEVFVKGKREAKYYREGKRNHLLFRPIGQRAFTRAVEVMMSRGGSIEKSVARLLKVNMYIDNENWHHILWDPVDKSMITNKLVIAETQLLKLAGQQPRNKLNGKKLDEFLISLKK